MTIKLNEALLAESEILENDPAKLPAGILSRVRRVICEINKKNANGRKYRSEVWEKVLGDEGFQTRLKNRQILGEMEHPENVQLKLDKDRTSHIVSNVFIDEKAGLVKADFDLLPTEAGKFIHILHEAGVKVPASTRAEGELKEAADEDGTKYQDVVPESYRFVTVDHTGDPSCSNTEPEAIVNAVRNHYENKSIDKVVALALLETITSEAATRLKESITVDEGHEGCGCAVDEKKCKKGCKKSGDAAHKADGKKLEKEIQTKFARGVAVGEAATAEPEEEKPVQTEEGEMEFEDMLWKEDKEGIKQLMNAPRNEEWRKKLSPRKLQILQTVAKRKELGEQRVQELMCPRCHKCNVPILGKGHENEQMCDDCAKALKDAGAPKEAVAAVESKNPEMDFYYVRGYIESMLKTWAQDITRENALENIKNKLESIFQAMNESEEVMTEDEKIGEALFTELKLEAEDFEDLTDEEVLEILNAKVEDYAKLEEKRCGFKKLTKKLAGKGAKNPKALAAYIGRKKYGKKKFQKAAAKGKKLKEAVEIAELLATLEVAKEEYDTLHAAKEAVMQNYVKDVSKQAEFNAVIKKLEASVNDLGAKLATAEASLAESAKAMDLAKKDFTQQLEAVKATNGKETKSLTESTDRQIKTIVEKHRKDLLHKYVECRLKFSGLSLTESARALLEQATSEDQVEKIIGEYRKALREGLHFSHTGNITLTEQRPVDTKRAEIDKRVGMAFGA